MKSTSFNRTFSFILAGLGVGCVLLALSGCITFGKRAAGEKSREAKADTELAKQQTPPSSQKVSEILETPQPGYRQESPETSGTTGT